MSVDSEPPAAPGSRREARFFAAGYGVVAACAVLAAFLVFSPMPELPNIDADRHEALLRMPYASGFDFPVGWPDARGYYDARSFGMKKHMGSDWNGVNGENTDLGDPVHAIAEGRVIFSGYAGPGWGECMILAHRLPGRVQDRQIDSFYGHLQSRLFQEGAIVRRGEKIGTIGTAYGRYLAHLHFEIRTRPWLGVRAGYHEDPRWWVDPTRFIRQMRRQMRLAEAGRQPDPGARTP